MSESAARRLFFALWPDEAVRQALWKATRSCVKASGGRPVPRENLHLTLAFLGNVPQGLLPELRAAAARLSLPGFRFVLDSAGYWPRPRVAWVAPSRVPRQLPELVAALWRVLEGLPVQADTRPYRPHLTVARKVSRPGELALERSVDWPVSEFCLVQSVTDPTGARYELLARYHLLQPTGNGNADANSAQPE